MEALEQAVSRVQADLRSGRFTNEAAVSQGAVLPLLQALGWPIFDTRVVAPEYTIEGRRVDYALCHPEDRPVVFLEAKRIGLTEGADRQLFEYAFHKGVPLAVLTDGQEWHFFLPAEQGDYSERRVYKLDLLERSPSESCQRFARYLAFEAVRSGKAVEAARADYQDAARERQVLQAMPRAWQRLVSEPDELLVEMLADKVEDVCGFKPTLDACADFLRQSSATPSPAQPTAVSPLPRPSARPSPAQSKPGQPGYSIGGQHHRCGTAREVASSVFAEFARKDPTFLERFAARKHGRKRRYISRNKTELYPDRPDLVQKCSFEFTSGWFMGTNYSKLDFEKIIRMACEVAGVEFGCDLIVDLGE